MSYKLISFSLSEYVAQKEEITNAIKANYEKALNIERTLKTQVKIQIFWDITKQTHYTCWVRTEQWLKLQNYSVYLNHSGGEQASRDYE